MDLFVMAFRLSGRTSDLKLRSQFRDAVEIISSADFEELDKLHYEIENKLLRLIELLETKRNTNDWRDTLPSTNPPIHYPPPQNTKTPK